MKLTAAVAQTASVLLDTPATVERALALMAQAAAQGAQLIVFPEAYLGGYPKGADFHIYLGARTPQGRAEYKLYYDAAVTVDGPEIALLAQAAAQHRMFVVLGIIERDGGTLYCTVVYLGPEGQVLGKHRKLMPTALERLVWGFGDGSTLKAVDTPWGRLGAVICWENYMPALRMAMYQQRVTIYCAPTADDRDTWASTMTHIALEGRCFVLSCNQFARRGDYPADFITDAGADPATVLSRGGSCIVNPMGEIVAGPDYTGEVILTADLDLGDVVRGKFDFDVVGHYARPDVFRLEVNERANSAVTRVAPRRAATADVPPADVPETD